MLVLCLKQPIDLGDEVLEMEWFGEELGFGSGSAALERNGRKSRYEHDPDRRINGARPLGQLDAIHLGHDYIRQKQVIFAGIEQGHGLGAASDRLYLITDALQCPLQIFAHRRIVFSQQNPDHRPCFMRACLNIFQRLAALLSIAVRKWYG